MRVSCSIEEISLETESGQEVDGVCVQCGRCGHEVESYGTSDKSVRRSLAVMREECLERENNFYVIEEE